MAIPKQDSEILPKQVTHHLQDSEIQEKGYTFVKGIVNPGGILSKLLTQPAKRSWTIFCQILIRCLIP